MMSPDSAAPTVPTFSVVIPALDEEGSVGAVVREVLAAADGLPVRLVEVVVVDNGSRDRTAAVAVAAGARVVAEPTPGYGRACLAGARAATGEILAFMVGDGSDVAAELPLLVGPIVRGEADLVLGSRVLGDAEPGSLTLPQRVGNAVAAFLFRRLYGLAVTDLGPFRAIRREHLLALGMSEMTYGWPTEMMARAAGAGLRVLEVPVTYRRRSAGRSKVSGDPRAAARAGWQILRVILRARRAAVPGLRDAGG